MCSEDCWKKVNTCSMVLATLLLFCGAVLVFYGGIEIYNIPYQTAVNELSGDVGLLTQMKPFLSCKDQYNSLWNNVSSGPGNYIQNDLVRGLTVARCGSQQIGPVALAGFTGFFLFCTGLAGVWAAWKGTRGAVFSSGITLSFTVALLVVNLCLITTQYSAIGVQLVACKGLSDDTMQALMQNSYYCFVGHVNGKSLPSNALPSDKVDSLSAFVLRAACYLAGCILGLISTFLFKYTTTSAFHYNRFSEDEVDGAKLPMGSQGAYAAPPYAANMYQPASR